MSAESTVSRFDQRGEDLPRFDRYPVISVVVPSYNQASYLEETLASLFGQGYPRLEVLVMDGGSQDGSVEVIRKYESKLASWCSEPDGGQAYAVRKGFERSKGEVLGFLNSDDVLLPGALFEVGSMFAAEPSVDWVSGGCLRFSSQAPCRPMRNFAPKARWVWVAECPLSQPSTFWRRSLYERLGPYPVDCRYSHDWHFWLMLAFGGARCRWVDRTLSGFRVHEQSATESQQAAIEVENRSLMDRYLPMLKGHERSCVAWEVRRKRAGTLAQESRMLALKGDGREARRLLWKAAVTHPAVLVGASFRAALRELRRGGR